MLLACLIAGPAQATTYHRFWRGMKLANLSATAFTDGLNQGLIPATVTTGAGKGLLAYQPILTMDLAGLPDEVALVSYDSLDAYNTLFATDDGKAYQALHGKYFDLTVSHSMIPQAYAGSVAIEQAYDLHPEYAGWKENRSTVYVVYREANESDADYLARAKAQMEDERGIEDRVILIAQQYWIEYVSAKYALHGSIPVYSEDAAHAKILPGRGVNLQF